MMTPGKESDKIEGDLGVVVLILGIKGLSFDHKKVDLNFLSGETRGAVSSGRRRGSVFLQM